ncbi:MAG TPA: aminoacetone oxidase family FAD-binding enzyme [Rhodothermales bacterium]|nr:aminoacetone oxidase family FAD-binding enzyme [Rhodothermales bacterium]
MSAAPVVVVGAGAAGLMAAYFAAAAGAPTLVLEGTKGGGKKIVVSGGGRCNVLPSEVRWERFVTASSPHTLRNLLRSWPLEEQRRYFEETLGLPLALEEETGKLFPASNRSVDVRDALLNAARGAGARFRFNTRVHDVRPAGDGWTVHLDGGETLAASAVVLATGGLSVPNTGSDGVGLRIAEGLGHTVHRLYPALTPMTADPAPHAGLSGVSLHVQIDAPGKRGGVLTEGGFLFTHRGWSGPTVLDVSHLATLSRLDGGPPQPVLVRWTALDAAAWHGLLQSGSPGTVATLLRRHLPARLAEQLQGEADVPMEKTLAQLRRDERARLVERLTRYPLPWTGDEGYRKAEVTGGGVALGEVSTKTLESRRHPGLFLSGELLDAFGPIGGYNFLWAWATGRLAGLGAARHVSLI